MARLLRPASTTRAARSSDVAIAAVPLGLALVALTGNWTGQGEIALLAGVLTASCGLILVRSLKGGWGALGRTTIVAGVLGWYCYPSMLDVFGQSASCDATQAIERTAYVSALTGIAAFLATACLVWSLAAVVRPSPDPPRADADPTLWAGLLCLAGLVPFSVTGQSVWHIVTTILASRAEEKIWRQVQPLGDASSAWWYLASSAMVAGAALLWVSVAVRGWARSKIALVIAAAATAILFFDSGTRSLFTLIVLPPLLLVLHRISRVSRIRALAAGLAAGALLVFALQLQMAYRSEATRERLSDALTQDIWLLGGTIDYFCETVVSYELVPALHAPFRESVALEFAVSPIPRFLWPSKPVSTLVAFFTDQRGRGQAYDAGGTILPGVVGQYYMNWGWFGVVLVGAGAGLLASFLDSRIGEALRLQRSYRAAVALMLATWALVSFRLVSPGFLYPVLFAAAILAVSRLRFRRTAPVQRSSGPPHAPGAPTTT